MERKQMVEVLINSWKTLLFYATGIEIEGVLCTLKWKRVYQGLFKNILFLHYWLQAIASPQINTIKRPSRFGKNAFPSGIFQLF